LYAYHQRKTMNDQEQHFTQLLYLFYSSAMVSLGKLKNPATDKIERNLEQAKQSIDILEMLKAKTKGNLSDSESRMLENFLTDLRLNYVDESNKDSVSS
jgi:hypothetical protein